MQKLYLFFSRYKYHLLIIFLICVFLFCDFFIFLFFNNKINNLNNLNNNISSSVIEDNIINDDVINSEKDIVTYYVDIKGEVVNPGVYLVSTNEIINEVINKAGGLTKNADTSYINLSKKVCDEMVIIIYSKDDINNYKNILNEKKSVINVIDNESFIDNDAIIIEKDIDNNTNDNDNNNINSLENNSLISINTGSLEELITIPGIGESKAKKIIEYREKNGLFNDLNDIKNVSGIGDSLFEKIKDYIKL